MAAGLSAPESRREVGEGAGTHLGAYSTGCLRAEQVWTHVEHLTCVLNGLVSKLPTSFPCSGVTCRCGCVVYPPPWGYQAPVAEWAAVQQPKGEEHITPPTCEVGPAACASAGNLVQSAPMQETPQLSEAPPQGFPQSSKHFWAPGISMSLEEHRREPVQLRNSFGTLPDSMDGVESFAGAAGECFIGTPEGKDSSSIQVRSGNRKKNRHSKQKPQQTHPEDNIRDASENLNIDEVYPDVNNDAAESSGSGLPDSDHKHEASIGRERNDLDDDTNGAQSRGAPANSLQSNGCSIEHGGPSRDEDGLHDMGNAHNRSGMHTGTECSLSYSDIGVEERVEVGLHAARLGLKPPDDIDERHQWTLDLWLGMRARGLLQRP